VDRKCGSLPSSFTDGARLPNYTWYVHVLSLYFLVLIISPATSTDVERVFSRGRILLSHIRNRLSAQSTRAIVCLGSWSLLGLIKDSDIFDVTKLPEEPTDPELEAEEWEAVFADIEGDNFYDDRLDVDYDF
jgi:hypothetical protein